MGASFPRLPGAEFVDTSQDAQCLARLHTVAGLRDRLATVYCLEDKKLVDQCPRVVSWVKHLEDLIYLHHLAGPDKYDLARAEAVSKLVAEILVDKAAPAPKTKPSNHATCHFPPQVPHEPGVVVPARP